MYRRLRKSERQELTESRHCYDRNCSSSQNFREVLALPTRKKTSAIHAYFELLARL
jgi:hypothetical protein